MVLAGRRAAKAPGLGEGSARGLPLETKGPSRGAVGSAMRYQKALGQHFILVVDGFVSKPEGRRLAQGARTELLIKF